MEWGKATLAGVRGQGHIYIGGNDDRPRGGTGQFVPDSSDPGFMATVLTGDSVEYRGPIHIDGRWRNGGIQVLMVRTTMTNSTSVALATAGAPSFD